MRFICLATVLPRIINLARFRARNRDLARVLARNYIRTYTSIIRFKLPLSLQLHKDIYSQVKL